MDSYPIEGRKNKEHGPPEEDEVKPWVARGLEGAGFKVYSEVTCRIQFDHKENGRGRIDYLAVAPREWADVNGFWTIGVECKAEGLETGEGIVMPTMQAGAYSRSFAFMKDGKPLPRPDVVIVAAGDALKAPLNLVEPRTLEDARFKLMERFLWKVGGVLLTWDVSGEVGFYSNYSVPSQAKHVLWRLPKPEGEAPISSEIAKSDFEETFGIKVDRK